MFHLLKSGINNIIDVLSSRILFLLHSTNTFLGGKLPLGLDNSFLSIPDSLRNSHGSRDAFMAEWIGFLEENGRLKAEVLKGSDLPGYTTFTRRMREAEMSPTVKLSSIPIGRTSAIAAAKAPVVIISKEISSVASRKYIDIVF